MKKKRRVRPKTKRRLLILLAGAVFLSCAFVGVILYRQREANHQLNQDRGDGLSAYKNHDWATAINSLTPYVNNRPDDPDALYALALSQLNQPNPTGGDIGEALERLRRYMEMVPDNLDAAHRLMSLELQLRHWDQVFDLSKTILAASAQDGPALSAQATALEAEGKSDLALLPGEQYNDVAPTDLDGYELTYQIMHSLKKSPSEMLAYARKFEKKYPKDPRFQLAEVLAWTVGKGSDASGAEVEQQDLKETHLLLAATQPPARLPDGQFVRYAVQLLDDQVLYQQSLDLLARDLETTAAPEPVVKVLYARRMYETRQFGRVVALKVQPLDPNPSLLAYTGLSYFEMNHAAKADDYLRALGELTNDPEAQAWTLALTALFHPTGDVAKQFDLLRQALDNSGGNGVLHYLLAREYQEASENDLALEEAKTAADLLPSWPAPHLMVAQLLASRGQIVKALRESDLALVTAGADKFYGLDPQVVRAQIAFQYASAVNETDLKQKLLSLLTQLNLKHPEETRILPMYIRLLAECGDAEEARDILDEETAHPDKSGGSELLIQLAQASHDEQLGTDLEIKLLDSAQKKFGETAELAYAYAAYEPAGKALADIQNAAKTSKGNASEWALLTAQVHQRVDPASAAAEWVAIGNQFPGNLQIQNAIADPTVAPSAWDPSQSAFLGTSIERLHSLTGEAALNWKLAKARWLLTQDSASSANLASVLMNDVLKHSTAAERPAPHELQARALVKLGNLDGAASELSQAWLLSPSDAQIGYELLRVYHSAGRYSDAVTTFDHLKDLPLDNSLAVGAAAVMFDENETQRAEDLLQPRDDPSRSPSTALVGLLAMCEQKLGEDKDAGDDYLRVMNAPDLTATIAAAGADFFATISDMPTAQKFLARLADTSANPTQRDLSLAAFQERFGKDAGSAEKLYLSAVASDSSSPAPAAAYIGFLIRQNRPADAAKQAALALNHFPSNAELRTLSTLAADLSGGPLANDLSDIAALVTQSAGEAAARDMLAALGDTSDSASQIDRLQQLIHQYPSYLPLYDITVRRLLATGHSDSQDQALDLATSAMDKFADQPLAARLACVAQAEVGHWTAALDDARQWRQRAFRQPLDADWHIALCLINLDRPDEAITTLDPYVADAWSAPDQPLNTQVIRTYAGALLAADRVSDASNLLLPLAAKSAGWRILWLGLAKESFKDGEDAAAWIQAIVPRIPPGGPDTKMLTQAWFDIARRFNYPAGYANCRALLLPDASAGKLDAKQLLTLAMCDEQASPTDAVEDYRRAITIAMGDPASTAEVLPAAQNNLANLLMNRNDGASLAEAESLARQAIAGSTADPNAQAFYCDTLGHVLLRQGKPADAAAEFAHADQLRPNDPAILTGWADASLQNGKVDQALQNLQQIDKAIASGARLGDSIQQELINVRAQMNRLLSAGAPTKP